jgi:hypothetical protein
MRKTRQQREAQRGLDALREKLGITTPREFYPGQTFERDGIHYRIVATDSSDRIALEISPDGRDWATVDVDSMLAAISDFVSQHGTEEEKEMVELTYARFPDLRRD